MVVVFPELKRFDEQKEQFQERSGYKNVTVAK